jgi:stage II sporulation protein D
MSTLLQKKIAWLFLLFFIIMSASSFPASASNPGSEDFQIRVLLSTKKPSIELASKNKQWLIAQSNSSFTPLSLSSPSLTFEILGSTVSTTLFSRSTSSWTWDQALLQAQSLKPCLEQSGLRVYLSPADHNQYFLDIGPFEKTKDAAFICTLLQSSGYQFFVQNLNMGHGFITISFQEDLFHLKSENFNLSQESISVWQITTPTNEPINFSSKNYPEKLILAYSPTQSLMLINELSIEEYLRSVVPAEMPNNWSIEALKAQAVASRSFALSRILQARKSNALFDVTNDTYTQVYLGCRYFPSSDAAVKASRHEILVSKGQVVESVFHSTSGGHTENNELVWSGGARSYLRGVISEGEEGSPHFTWYKSFKEDHFISEINKYLAAKGRPERLSELESSQILEKGVSPRVRKILLHNQNELVELSGSEFQSIFSLKSTWFDLLIWKADTSSAWWKDYMNPETKDTSWVYIYGRGWGHGVGMSQYGAGAQARKGLNYTQILEHFFKGSQIEQMASYLSKAQNLSENAQISSKTTQVSACHLSFSPTPLNIMVQKQWRLELLISSTSSMQGFSLDLLYDPTHVTIEENNISEGTFLNAGNKTTLFLKKKENNKIHIGLAREGKAGGVSGEGTLLVIEGIALQEGTSEIYLNNIHVFNSQLEELESSSSNGILIINKEDLIPPKTLIIEYPPRYNNQSFVTFRWIGSDNQTKIENLFYSYRINEEPWSTFSKNTSYTFHLNNDGAYVFSVKARDEANLIDPAPPVYTFFIDTTPPFLELDVYENPTLKSEILLQGKTEPEVTLLVNAVKYPVGASGSFECLLPLKIGNNLIRFITIDPSSNTSTKDIIITRNPIPFIEISLSIGSLKAIVNQEIKTLTIAPFIEQNRTFVPLRFIAESFQSKVDWNATEKKILITLEHPLIKKSITLWLGSKIAFIDGEMVALDVPPLIKPPGHTFVPIRFIAESFGSKVDWFPQTQSIKIVFPDPEKIVDLNQSRRKLVISYEK